MSNFKIGQEVVCIEGCKGNFGINLIEGNIYTVLDTENCCTENIYVGIPSESGSKCRKCDNMLSYTNKWFHMSSRFVTLDEFAEMNEVSEAMKNETKVPISILK
jgi:hypothetical protein